MGISRIIRVTAATAAVAAGVGVYVAHWSSGPVRYFTPGPLGKARSTRSATGSDRPPDRGFLTRVIGLRTAEETEWGRRNGLTDGIPFSHNMEHVFPRSLYASHPEFFPLTDGKRLNPPANYHYWNPDLGREDVAHFAAEQARAAFAQNARQVSYSLGVNDGLVFGDSPETMALVTPHRWFRGRPDLSRLVFTFMNRAAADLARTYPDKYLGCLAYYWCENAPPFAVDPHVIPFVTADRTQNYDPAFRAEEFDLQRRWALALRAGATKQSGANTASAPRVRIGMYDYLDGYGFLVPRVPIHALAEHLRHAHRLGFTDYYGESSRNWGIDGPMPWVITQLLLDPEQNVEPLLNEYYASYFQSAAVPMRRFFDRCEQQWMQQPGRSYWLKYYRDEVQAEVFPRAVRAELRALLDEAGRLAAADQRWFTSGVVRDRVAFVSDAFGVTERFCALQEARTELSTRIVRGELNGPSGEQRLREYREARAEFIRYTHAVTERRPLAFYPIDYQDWLENDPTFAAENALVRSAQQTTAHPRPQQNEDGLNTAAGEDGREILNNPLFDGPLVPGRKISGLNYGIDLPAPWQGKMEPAARAIGVLLDRQPAGRGPGIVGQGSAPVPPHVHVRGAENTRVYQWLPVTAGRFYAASVRTRGQITSTARVDVMMAWLNTDQQFVGGVSAMRLPAGFWPDWVRLEQGASAPTGAAWLGVSVRVYHQDPADWADFADFSVREFAVPPGKTQSPE